MTELCKGRMKALRRRGKKITHKKTKKNHQPETPPPKKQQKQKRFGGERVEERSGSTSLERGEKSLCLYFEKEATERVVLGGWVLQKGER